MFGTLDTGAVLGTLAALVPVVAAALWLVRR
jgi:hypothetical protein